MGLLGAGVMVLWYDSSAEAEHDVWHSHEHLLERVGVPGFLRGRRGIAVSGRPKYFIMYDVQDIAILTSQPYLERLNNPTPWTQKVMTTIQHMNRSLCRVTASFGTGIGTQLLTIRLSPKPDQATTLRDWLVTVALPGLVRKPGCVGACLLVVDKAASRIETEEKRLRQDVDDIADWVILVDGYDVEAIQGVSEGLLSQASLIEHGASSEQVSARYHLVHIMSDSDVLAASLEPPKPV